MFFCFCFVVVGGRSQSLSATLSMCASLNDERYLKFTFGYFQAVCRRQCGHVSC